MTTVLALFDDGNGSVRKAIGNTHKVISVGIQESEHPDHRIINLASESCLTKIKDLNKDFKFDYIVASPPCESWSNGAQCKLGGGNHNWRWTERDLSLQPISKSQNFSQRIIGEQTIFYTIKIIEQLKPKHFYIENPETSYIWKYIFYNFYNFYKEGFRNNFYYNNFDYENFSKKPTTFFSDLNLGNCKINLPTKIKIAKINTYNQRSAIPTKLIKNIITIFDKN